MLCAGSSMPVAGPMHVVRPMHVVGVKPLAHARRSHVVLGVLLTIAASLHPSGNHQDRYDHKEADHWLRHGHPLVMLRPTLYFRSRIQESEFRFELN
jgi:hypothetical protein